MARRHNMLASGRDEALQYLFECKENQQLQASHWVKACKMSDYSKRQLMRLIKQREDEPDAKPSGFHLDEACLTAVFLTVGRIAGAYRQLERDGHESLPTLRQFQRIVNKEMGTLMLSYARGGSQFARQFKVYLKTKVVHRNHTWELDHTELPIWVVPHGHKQAVRPWLTVAMDRATRYPMSWVLTFGRPSSEEVRACLIQAITVRVAPDDQTLVGGRPMRAVWDRGLEFLAEAITMSCTRLGVIPVALPAFSPQLKPHLERFWGFLKRDCLASLPGYTDDVRDVRGNSSIASSCLGEGEFLLKLDEWFTWYITEHVHSGIGCTPLQAWQRDGTPLDEVPASQLWLDFLVAKDRVKVRREGVRFHTVDFIAPELIGTVGRKVEVRHLPHDLTFIEVFLDNEHLCTAYPRHASTPEQEQALLEHRKQKMNEATRHSSVANRMRRTNHDSTAPIARNKQGQMVLREVEHEDLLIDGEEAYLDLIGNMDTTDQGALW
jgi:putative transposase